MPRYFLLFFLCPSAFDRRNGTVRFFSVNHSRERYFSAISLVKKLSRYEGRLVLFARVLPNEMIGCNAHTQMRCPEGTTGQRGFEIKWVAWRPHLDYNNEGLHSTKAFFGFLAKRVHSYSLHRGPTRSAATHGPNVGMTRSNQPDAHQELLKDRSYIEHALAIGPFICQ